MTTYYTSMESPVQTLLLTSDGTALTGLYLVEHNQEAESGEAWVRSDDATPFTEAKRQIAAYFKGELKEFDLPIRMNGTPFQQRVWEALQNIPYGSTISYGELASRVGNPNAPTAS
jgi:methylated-DNA-[protein]-cysteine S-methyltransferase